MNIFRNNMFRFFLFMGLTFFVSIVGDLDINAKGLPVFTYNIEFPKNQTDTTLEYYDLKVKKGEKQKLKIVVSNPSKKEITILPRINNAKSNANGLIEYGESDIDDDESLKYKMDDILEKPKDIVLKAGETKTIEFKLESPDKSFDGVIAGGIQLIYKENDDDYTKNKKSMIKNNYAYIIPIVLKQNDNKIEPNLKFRRIAVSKFNYQKSILLEFSNISPEYMDNVDISAQVMKNSSDKVLYEVNERNYKLAPNSLMKLPLNNDITKIEPGKYVAKILIKSEGKTWKWDEKFSITQDDLNKIDGVNDSTSSNSFNFLWIVLLGLLIMVILSIILFIIIRNVRS